LVAEVDGEPLAMAAGFDAPTQRGFPDDPLTPPRGLARLRYLSIGFALWPCLRQIGRMEEGDFYVFAIATAPEARGLGLGTRLLEETEGRARAAGCARLALDVAHANEGAQRLYRRRGFAVAGQPSWWVPKRLRIVRMTRRLGPAASQGSGGAGEF
ncbi:MAG: N-acetyltransferase, partial [Planctomycetota bacterium]